MQNKSDSPHSLVCDICGQKGAQVHHVTRSYGKGSRLLVIEEIPVVVCPHCGESYMTAATLHEIEKIKRRRATLASKKPVAVAVFA